MVKDIVIATQNKHKIEEIEKITKNFGFRLLSGKEAGIDGVDVVEDGTTFEENSYKKASEIMKLTGMITIADDSGLEVDALNGAPGVYSARFAGEDASDEDNNRKLMAELKGVPFEKRTARYVCVITMLFPDGRKLVARGESEGYIAEEPSGNNGFGYDPYFIPEGYDKTFGCFDMDEKNKISHRARALEKLAQLLDQEENR